MFPVAHGTGLADYAVCVVSYGNAEREASVCAMTDGSSDLRDARKDWKERNSDGRFAWPAGTRIQSPPGFVQEEHDMPDTVRINADARNESGMAIRHTHVYEPEEA